MKHECSESGVWNRSGRGAPLVFFCWVLCFHTIPPCQRWLAHKPSTQAPETAFCAYVCVMERWAYEKTDGARMNWWHSFSHQQTFTILLTQHSSVTRADFSCDWNESLGFREPLMGQIFCFTPKCAAVHGPRSLNTPGLFPLNRPWIVDVVRG